jgi:hypothetical protein
MTARHGYYGNLHKLLDICGTKHAIFTEGEFFFTSKENLEFFVSKNSLFLSVPQIFIR